PKIFEGLPAELVTHTSDPHDFASFRGKEVVVVGAGQSALEAAGFLNAAGARVEVLVRNPVLHWLRVGWKQWLHAKPISWMFYGKADVGPAGISLFVQRPNLFRRLPPQIQTRWAQRAIRPAVVGHIVHGLEDLVIHAGR